MELEHAIKLLKKAVKDNGTNDTKHLDLGLISSDQRPTYQKALVVAKLAVLEGKLTHDELLGKIHLTN